MTWTRPVRLSTSTSAISATKVSESMPHGHAQTPAAGRRRGLPAELLGGGLQDADRSLVLQVLQAEFDRVHLGLGRHDVDLRFAGEGVRIVGRGARQAPVAKGCGRDPPPKPPPALAVR